MTTFEAGTGTGPKSAQKFRRRRARPGPVVPRCCLGCADRCNCAREIPAPMPRFMDCFRAPKEATK